MAWVSTAPTLDRQGLQSPEELKIYREELLAEQDPNQPLVIVCQGTGCLANGSPRVTEALKKSIAAAKIKARVMPGIKTTGCHGFCSRGPLVIVRPRGVFYQRVKPDDADELVKTTLLEGNLVERLLYLDPQTREPIPLEPDIPFYKNQQRIVLRNIGKVDPTDLRDTITRGGYQALAKALTTLSSDEIIKCGRTIRTSRARRGRISDRTQMAQRSGGH